jgi:membrane protein involved in colicin uptake
MAVELRNAVTRGVSSLPTADELQAYLKKESDQRRIERAERETRDKREKDKRAADRAAEDAAVNDLIGGLKSIEERIGSELTNYEMNAVRMAISKHEKDRETVISHRMAFEGDEFKGR